MSGNDSDRDYGCGKDYKRGWSEIAERTSTQAGGAAEITPWREAVAVVDRKSVV